MSVTPIEIQTNFVQQANVDRMRQAEVQQNQGAQVEGEAINKKIVEESKNVLETSDGEAGREIKEDDEKRDSGKKSGGGEGGKAKSDDGSGTAANGQPARQMRDPSKGKFVDITL